MSSKMHGLIKMRTNVWTYLFRLQICDFIMDIEYLERYLLFKFLKVFKWHLKYLK